MRFDRAARIVAIEIPVTRLVGKWKVSQNQPDANRDGVIVGLHALGSEDATAMARLMESYRPSAT